MNYIKLISISLANFCLYWIVLGFISNEILDINVHYFDLLSLVIIGSFVVSIVRFLIQEIRYRTFQKDKLITFFYQALIEKGFPNPWNYYIDPNYLLDVANTDGVNATTRVQAMRLWSEINILHDSGKIFQSNRFKFALVVAINKYFSHFKDEYQVTPDLESTHADLNRDAYQTSYLGILIFN